MLKDVFNDYVFMLLLTLLVPFRFSVCIYSWMHVWYWCASNAIWWLSISLSITLCLNF